MTSGIELNIPKTVILKFSKATLKLSPKSGFTSLLTRQINIIANTMYKLSTKLKKDENLKALKDLGNETGKTNAN